MAPDGRPYRTGGRRLCCGGQSGGAVTAGIFHHGQLVATLNDALWRSSGWPGQFDGRDKPGSRLRQATVFSISRTLFDW
jgi:hypothetical protein